MKKNENVLYTDGHDIVVTASEFRVRRKWYSLSGITRHGLAIVRPLRFPGFALLLAGALLEIAGAARIFPSDLTPSVYAFGIVIGANKLAMIVGFALLVVGGMWMWFLHERYAVSITTAEGEQNVVVSRHKEYVTQIVHALNEALFARIGSNDSEGGKKREFVVSHR